MINLLFHIFLFNTHKKDKVESQKRKATNAIFEFSKNLP